MQPTNTAAHTGASGRGVVAGPPAPLAVLAAETHAVRPSMKMKPEPHFAFAGYESWEEYQASLKLPALDENMDPDVRERLELVRKLAHFGFYEYEFIDVALDRGLATLELMLRRALGTKPRGLHGLVARAKAVGWAEIARRAEVLVKIRNGYAHADRNLQWSVAGLAPLQILFEVANELATSQHTGDRSN